MEGTSSTSWLLYGEGSLHGGTGMAPVCLATSGYQLPQILANVAGDRKTVAESRQQQGTSANFVTYRTPDYLLYELLGGGWRKKLPAYASTYHGDENGGLTTPDDFAQFALRCKEQYGYPAFKIHGWVNGPIKREVEAVLAIRQAVGDDMDLLLDPAGCFTTFENVLKVGRACDEAPEGPGLGVAFDWDFIAAHKSGACRIYAA